jgi:uncharacterized protein
MSLLDQYTAAQQSKLAEYCRSGQVPDGLNGVRAENLHHYRRLVFNIASDILETAYPITHSYLDESIWNELVTEYFTEHKCKTAQVWRMPLEFYEYCRDKKIAERLNKPFLDDLLHFEWLELEVHTMEDLQYPASKSEGDWMNGPLAINPEHRLLSFSYPVHTTSPVDLENAEKGNYYLLIYREKDSGNVQFIDLSVFYVFLLENLINGAVLSEILEGSREIFGFDDLEVVKAHCMTFINDLRSRGFITGLLF